MTIAESKQLQVNRCSVDSITLYEITEQELELLEQGSPSSTLLNLAISSVSLAFAFLTTLLTVDIENMKIFSVFVIVTVVGFLAGIALLVVWRQMARSTKSVVSKIRSRQIEPSSPVEAMDNVAVPNDEMVIPVGPSQAG